jgi:hypothetical protein
MYANFLLTRRHLAELDGLSRAALEILMVDPSMEVRQPLAYNKVEPTPVWVLERLASDPGNFVRWQVAYNGGTPQKVLERLKHCLRMIKFSNGSSVSAVIELICAGLRASTDAFSATRHALRPAQDSIFDALSQASVRFASCVLDVSALRSCLIGLAHNYRVCCLSR